MPQHRRSYPTITQAVLQWASDRAEYIVLGVTLGNDSARALYESAGFQAFGEYLPGVAVPLVYVGMSGGPV